MKSFIETLINRKFNLAEEALTLHKLLKETSFAGSSLYAHINSKFRKWHHRANYISLDQLFDKTGMDAILSYTNRFNTISLDNFIYFSECIYNIMFVVRREDLGTLTAENRELIFQNIENIFNQLNYEIVYCEHDDYYRIIEKDWKTTISAEIVKDNYSLGEKIYLYRHYSFKGQLFDKADILCRLYKVFEGQYEKILKANQYTTLADNIGFLSDKLDVRHAPNPKEKSLLEGFSIEEQEQWYDDLFEMYLDMLILCNHIEKRKDVKELSKKFATLKTN